MSRLPRASGDKHVSAFKAAGWQVNQSDIHLSIPVYINKTLGVGLLKKLINKAGMTNEEYLKHFHGK